MTSLKNQTPYLEMLPNTTTTRSRKGGIPFHIPNSVIRTVWVRLPHVSPDHVRRLRRLYTKAINHYLRALQKGNRTVKQLYHEMRATPNFSKLPAPMLDRAGREAATWHYWRHQRSYLTETKLQSWKTWAQRQNITVPKLKPGPPRRTSYPTYLRGYPGSRRGQWPLLTQGAVRFYPDHESGTLKVTIQRIIQKTPALVGGSPETLLRQGLAGNNGCKLGCSRLQVRDNSVYLVVPVTTAIAPQQLQTFRHPTVVGVDLGVNTLAAAVALTPDGRFQPVKVVSGKRLKHRLRVLWRHRRQVHQRGSAGQVQRIDTKIRRVIQHWVHVTAQAIVQYALRFPQPVIALEDLRNYRPYRWRTPWADPRLRDQLSKWARGKMAQAICNKAALRKIPVVRVDPAYSSHTCVRGCVQRPQGTYKKPNRGSYFRIFQCPVCGVKVPRDVNAAIELARRGLRVVLCHQ